MRRPAISMLAVWLLGVLTVGAVCYLVVWELFRYQEAKTRYHDQQHALFAAEAGVEAARIYLAGVCSDSGRRAKLLESAVQQEIAMPGQEGTLRKFFGYTLPGSGSVIVRLRTSTRTAGVTFVTVRSAGQAGKEHCVLYRDLECPASR